MLAPSVQTECLSATLPAARSELLQVGPAPLPNPQSLSRTRLSKGLFFHEAMCTHAPLTDDGDGSLHGGVKPPHAERWLSQQTQSGPPPAQ